MKYLHSMIRISDLQESLHFFCDILGFQEISRYESDAGRFTNIFIAAPDDVEAAKIHKAPVIELTYNWDKEIYKGGRNFGHLAFRVDNIYDICTRIMDAGITIARPPRDGYMAFIRTPDNISIELLQKGDALPPCEPFSSMQNIGEW